MTSYVKSREGISLKDPIGFNVPFFMQYLQPSKPMKSKKEGGAFNHHIS